MQALRTHQKMSANEPRPISGWALSVVLQLDEVEAGFARWAMRASTLRRQLIGLVAAEVIECGPIDVAARLNIGGEVLQQIVSALMSWPAPRLISAVLGSTPEGFVGALSKVGDQPLDETDGYRALHDLLINGGRMRIQVVKQARSITYGMIQRLLGLDPLVCHAGFTSKLRTMKQVRAVNHVVRLAQELAGADADRIRASVEHQDDPAEWAKRWIGKAQRLPFVPPQLGPQFRVLNTPDEMREVARRYQNCVKSKIVGVFAGGRQLYAEWVEEPVLVELVPLEPGEKYLLAGIHGLRNCRPRPSVAKAIWTRLAEAGVLTHAARLQSEVVGHTLELAGTWDHFDPHFNLEDEEEDG